MARRKKKTRRLTLKKKPNKDADRKTPEGLSPRQFATLPQEYGSFTAEDIDHEMVTFAFGDMAYIRYQDLEDNAIVPEKDYWIGEVKEIRGNDRADVWVLVQWLWSPQEVAEVIKSFNPDICGEYEKLASDNTDIISAHCFVSHVDVKRFEETSIYQVSIREDEWFTRYDFLYNAIRISPKVTHFACAICKVPYTPGKKKILHFCPRPKCRDFYHQTCLVTNKYVEETRAHRVLETWPDNDRTVSVETLSDQSPPTKRQKQNDSMAKGRETRSFEDFPARLIAVADQQIIRGTLEGGIVGNITAVSAARQLIYRALTRGDIISEDWETMIDISATSPDIGNHPNCVCPSCLSPI